MTDQAEGSNPAISKLAETVEATQSLATTMAELGLSRIHVSVGEIAIELDGPKTPKVSHRVSSEVLPTSEHDSTPQPETQSNVGFHIITAPMIGTFYYAAGPDQPVYVKVGDHVEKDQTIGIIEAMKIMNQIAADKSGKVVEIVAANSVAVEYGSPLIKIRPDDPIKT